MILSREQRDILEGVRQGQRVCTPNAGSGVVYLERVTVAPNNCAITQRPILLPVLRDLQRRGYLDARTGRVTAAGERALEYS